MPAPLARIRPGVPGVALATLAVATAGAFAAGLLEPISLAISVGGALAVARATFSGERIRATWARVWEALAEPGAEAADEEIESLIATVKQLARVHRLEGAPGLERALAGEPIAALERAGRHALDAADSDELAALLDGEARREASDGEAACQVLTTLGKLFPAFGLIGTLIGLAHMLPRLGSGDVTTIGPGLGVAVLTTLYGALLANAVVLPLATKLQASIARRLLVRGLVATGVELVHRRAYPTQVERAMRAYVGTAPREPGRIVLLHERAA